MNKILQLVRCENITKTYGNTRNQQVHAVNGVTLSILQGETFGLVGESGCGKSTLGYILLNLIPPTGGHIYYRNIDIRSCKSRQKKELRQHMQVIFQDPYLSLNPKMKIDSLVREGLDIQFPDMIRKEKEQRVDQMLLQVGLDPTMKYCFSTGLSGGQRQRIAIAQALIVHPEFVVCDEPVSALDVSIQAQVLNLLQELQETHRLTYFFISHNLNVVSHMADRIAVMYLGTIVELGSAKQVYEHPQHPYTQILFNASSTQSKKGENTTSTAGSSKSKFFPSGCPFHPHCRFCSPRCIREKPKLVEDIDGTFCACHFCTLR